MDYTSGSSVYNVIVAFSFSPFTVSLGDRNVTNNGSFSYNTLSASSVNSVGCYSAGRAIGNRVISGLPYVGLSSSVNDYSPVWSYYGLQSGVNPDITVANDSIVLEPTADNTDGRVAFPLPDSLVGAEPLELTIDVPIDETLYGDVYPLPSTIFGDLVEDLYPDLIDDDLKIIDDATTADPEPEPPITDVLVPLLPIQLPDFHFNLSGIWHYVREWVASLGAWFTLTFQIWASLPYAMVVPVYATAVVVIVLGVYRRFFM